MSKFMEGLSLDGMINAYTSIRIAKAQAAGQRYASQAVDQVRTLMPAEYDDGTEAIRGGNAVVPGANAFAQMAGIPVGLIYGGLLLGGSYIAYQVVK